MFVCHKCGKILVSKQAFTYHMNRKRPCIFKSVCTKCNAQFDTKFDLYIHRIHCKPSLDSTHSENQTVAPELNAANEPTVTLVMKQGKPFEILHGEVQTKDFLVVTIE